MRAVLLSLVLANALYWVWTRSSSPDPTVAVASLDPDLPSIELIERKVSPEALASQAVDAMSIEAVLLPSGGADDVIDVDSANDNAANLTTAESGISTEQDSSERLEPGATTSIGADENAVPGDSTSIETGPISTQAVSTTAAEVVEPVNVADIGNLIAAVDPVRFPERCISIGPFSDLKLATTTSSRLRTAGLDTAQRIEQAQVWVGHWVYLPQFESRSEAKVAVEKLRKAGVEDIYIEPSGELANTVSLGLFSDIERAEIRAGQIRKLDVRPQIQDRHKDGLVYYVDFPLSAGRRVNMVQIQNQAGPEVVKARRIECVASGVAEVS